VSIISKQNNIFKINQNIEVGIKYGPLQGIYHSRIENVSEDTLEIAIPSKHGHLLQLPQEISFTCRLALHSSLYVFKTKIIRVEVKQHVPTWVVEIPEDIEKIQRRSFIRIDIRLPVCLKIVDDEMPQTIQGQQYTPQELQSKTWDVSTKDLSGSGARLISKFQLPEKLLVSLELTLPEIGKFFTVAQVIRSELSNPEFGLYWTGVNFIALSEVERDKVVRYIFKKQIELRKRSLL
jgi:c-di-GMP-binding flagellar brake protein YcgR